MTIPFLCLNKSLLHQLASQLLRELEFQLAQGLYERHGLDVTNSTAKFDHASRNRLDIRVVGT